MKLHFYCLVGEGFRGAKFKEGTVIDSEQSDIKAASSQIENDDVLLALLPVESVRDRSSCGFV